MFDTDLTRVYALALLAIARADGEIDAAEGARLEERIRARTQSDLELADLLLAEPVSPAQLFQAVDESPFRGSGVTSQQLAGWLVADALDVILEKGHASGSEGRLLEAYARALGLSRDEVRRVAGNLARWIPEEEM